MVGTSIFRAQDGLRHIDIEIQQNIILAAFEEFMRLHIQHEEQTSLRTAILARRPSPFKRICVPTSTPAGICTFFLTFLRSKPLPRQVLHGEAIVSPRPLQVGHGAVCTI
jgi:hypothetical protein